MVQHSLRYQWYRFKYRYGRHLPLRTPVDVTLELASACNMSCAYCYHADKANLPFTQGIMPYDIACSIIRQCADYGVNSIKTNWKGESTLNPRFRDITRLAKDLASGTTLIDRITNSNFKFKTSRDDIFEGLANQTKVKVSFDSFDPKTFHEQRKGGDHGVTFANIDKFYHHKNRVRSETELVIQAVRTKLNADEDIEGLAHKLWPSAIISIRDVVAGRLDDNIDELEIRKRDIKNRQSCLQAHVRLIFNYKGKAFPCCPDIKEKLCLGDIHEQTLKEIFNSKRSRNLRKWLKDKSAFYSEPCRTCSSFESYRGFKSNWVS